MKIGDNKKLYVEHDYEQTPLYIVTESGRYRNTFPCTEWACWASGCQLSGGVRDDLGWVADCIRIWSMECSKIKNKINGRILYNPIPYEDTWEGYAVYRLIE